VHAEEQLNSQYFVYETKNNICVMWSVKSYTCDYGTDKFATVAGERGLEGISSFLNGTRYINPRFTYFFTYLLRKSTASLLFYCLHPYDFGPSYYFAFEHQNLPYTILFGPQIFMYQYCIGWARENVRISWEYGGTAERHCRLSSS